MLKAITRATIVLAALTLLALLLGAHAVLVNAQGETVDANASGIDATDMSSAGNVSGGVHIRAVYTNTAPQHTLQQLEQIKAQQARANRTGPLGPTAIAPTTGNPGPGLTPRNAPLQPLAETDFAIFRDTVLPTKNVDGTPIGWQYTMEPSSGVNGQNNFITGNWAAARSFDNGNNWQFLDPYTIFPDTIGGSTVSNFCCDQVTLYDPDRDLEFWLLQYGNGLKLAVSAGSDLYTNWCVWNITGASFGNANFDIDYNDMALGTRFLYIASNLFLPKSGASGVLRWPLEALANGNCPGFNYNFFVRTDSFTLKPVQGASDVMYFGSNWGQTNGSSFRVYKWPESSGSYSYATRTVAAFSFEYRNGGQNCGSADGVVKNWCQYADSRVLAGYRANGVLGFAFNSKACCGIPFPFSRRVYFRESDLSYLSSHSLWCTVCAVQFLSLAPNRLGHVGGSFAWGGGTTDQHFYPGGGLMLDDDVTPAAPWNFDTFLFGQGNTCQYNDNGKMLYRWGDYLTVRPFYPTGDAFLATSYRIAGGDCGTVNGYAEPHSVVFGRARDAGSYNRWSSK